MNDKSEGGDAPPIATLDLLHNARSLIVRFPREAFAECSFAEEVENVMRSLVAEVERLRAALARRSGETP